MAAPQLVVAGAVVDDLHDPQRLLAARRAHDGRARRRQPGGSSTLLMM